MEKPFNVFRHVVKEHEECLYEAKVHIEELLSVDKEDTIARLAAKKFIDGLEDMDHWYYIDPNTGKEKVGDDCEE